MPRRLEKSLEDLQNAKSQIKHAAAYLFNITRNGEGGEDIKSLRFDLLELMDACDEIQDIWEAEEGVPTNEVSNGTKNGWDVQTRVLKHHIQPREDEYALVTFKVEAVLYLISYQDLLAEIEMRLKYPRKEA